MKVLLVNVLSISDITIPYIYSPQVRNKFSDVDFVIACGDLPYYYQEYIISMLNVPLYFVRGNHDPVIEYGANGERKYPLGGVDLHRRTLQRDGVIFAGIEGSIRYSPRGNFQYTRAEMWRHAFYLVPGLLRNRLLYGRFLDILATHASPWGIHDKPDWPHQGIKAFNWLIRVFQPKYHFHGHIHVYRPDTITETQFGPTRILNTYSYRKTEIAL
ncbi:MAG: metallophosphoesterase [Chloroflexi bacterium]|nr:metallophosphoesterase [Chloroflexota bacterium]